MLQENATIPRRLTLCPTRRRATQTGARKDAHWSERMLKQKMAKPSLSLATVSYTHLDVYKRQHLRFLFFSLAIDTIDVASPSPLSSVSILSLTRCV